MDGLSIKQNVDSAPTVFAGYFDVCLAALTARGRGLYCFQPQRMTACLASKQTPYLSLPRKRESERYAACFDEVVARRARFPTCGAVRVAGYSVVWACDPTPHISPKEHQKERCGHFRSQRSFITFYGALRNILLPAGFPAMFHMIMLEQTFVNGPLQKKFSCCCF